MFIADTHQLVASYATTPSSPNATKVNAQLHDSCEASSGSLTKCQGLYKNNPTIPTAFQDCIAALCKCHYTSSNNNNYTIIVTTTRGVNCKSYIEPTPKNTLKQLTYAVHIYYN
jgi:hypothetical protein